MSTISIAGLAAASSANATDRIPATQGSDIGTSPTNYLTPAQILALGTFAGLADVDTYSPSEGDVWTYHGGVWQPQAGGGGGGGGAATNVTAAIAALPGVVAHYPLNDPAGSTTIVDVIGGYNGSCNTAPFFGSGGISRDASTAVRFQDASTNGYINLPSAVVPTSGEWYMGFMYQCYTETSHILFTSDSSYGSGSVTIGIDSSNRLAIGFATSSPTSIYGTSLVARHLVVVCFTGDAYSHNYGYLDGALVWIDSFDGNGYGANPRIAPDINYAAKMQHVFFGAGNILTQAEINSVWNQF
jgi:hypothetical protein